MPGASVVRLASGAVPPTTPLNAVVPAVFTARVNGPPAPESIVLAKVMLPAEPIPLEASTESAVNTTGSL